MPKYKILMTRSLLQDDQEYITRNLKKKVGECFELIAPQNYTEDEICHEAENTDILLGPYVSKKILASAPKLKLIQVPWTGMDTFDFGVMDGITIPVCNSHSNADAVAELGVALIMDLLKKISYHDRKMRLGSWNRDKKPLNLSSKMISNETFCILGYGKIGRKLGVLLSAFGAKIISVSRKGYKYSEVAEAYSTDEILTAVNRATVVVNALPLTNNTRSLINTEFLENMSKGSFLVNISRAAVIDEDAVYEALIGGHLAGFASDLWWNTPKRGESYSWPSTHNKFEKLEQVVMSPHRAGFIENALPHLDDAVENIARLINGEELINIVSVEDKF